MVRPSYDLPSSVVQSFNSGKLFSTVIKDELGCNYRPTKTYSADKLFIFKLKLNSPFLIMKNANNMYKHCKKLILEKIYLNAD